MQLSVPRRDAATLSPLTSRTVATLLAGAALCIAAGPAHADLTANGEADGLPASYSDETGLEVNQVAVEPEPPATTSTEVTYYLATAVAGPWEYAVDIHGDTAEGAVGGAIAVENRDATPNATYTIVHPYGTDTVTADDDGEVRATLDVFECEADCAGPAGVATRIGPFLRGIDGSVSQVGAPVVGSPHDSNFVRVSGPDGTISTDDFDLEADVETESTIPFAGFAPKSLALGSAQVGSTGGAQSVTLTNRGGGDAINVAEATLGGANADQFTIVSNSCDEVARGASCQVGVALRPTSTGAKNATLTIDDDAFASPPRVITLAGNGTAVPATPQDNPPTTTNVGPSTSGPSTAAPDTTGPAVTVSRRARRMSRRGIVALAIGCPAGEAAGCAGRVTLDTAGRVQTSARRRVRLGSKAFRLAAGERGTVRIRVNRRAIRILRRLGRTRVRVRVVARDGAGNARTITRTVVLSAAR
jgi:hypothetical protein